MYRASCATTIRFVMHCKVRLHIKYVTHYTSYEQKQHYKQCSRPFLGIERHHSPANQRIYPEHTTTIYTPSSHDHANLNPTTLNPLILLALLWRIIELLLRLARIPPILLLLLPTILHLLLLLSCARVPSSGRLRIAIVRTPAHRVRALVMRLPVILMLRLVMLLVVIPRHLLLLPTSLLQLSTSSTSRLKLNKHPPLVVLGIILQPQLLTQRLDLRLDLLDVSRAVVALPDNNVQMRLPRALRIPDPLLENLLRFLYILAVQIYRIRRNFTHRVILPENEFGGLLVVVVGRRGVLFALLRGVVGARAVAGGVGLRGLSSEVLVFALFFAGEGAEAVVFGFGGGGGAVVEGCGEWAVSGE